METKDIIVDGIGYSVNEKGKISFLNDDYYDKFMFCENIRHREGVMKKAKDTIILDFLKESPEEFEISIDGKNQKFDIWGKVIDKKVVNAMKNVKAEDINMLLTDLNNALAKGDKKPEDWKKIEDTSEKIGEEQKKIEESQPVGSIATSTLIEIVKKAKETVNVLLKKADEIHGGKADDKKDEEFKEEDLEKGKEVEFEHTVDEDISEEIAKDHLEEHPKYYEGLKEMEDDLTKEESISSAIDTVKEYFKENFKGDKKIKEAVKSLEKSLKDIDLEVVSMGEEIGISEDNNDIEDFNESKGVVDKIEKIGPGCPLDRDKPLQEGEGLGREEQSIEDLKATLKPLKTISKEEASKIAPKFKEGDRVWFKVADYISEIPGRIIARSEDKVIVDWGDEIPTEEKELDLMLAEQKGDLNFDAPMEKYIETEDKGTYFTGDPVEANEEDNALNKISFADTLNKFKEEISEDKGETLHVGLGIKGKIVSKTDNKISVVFNNKENEYWNQEVKLF